MSDLSQVYFPPKFQVWSLFKKEFFGYFITPIAYIFAILFLILSGIFTFYLGSFFERGQADLVPFFNFHPWLYLFFIPALTMSMWAGERQQGTIELLLTLPISHMQAVLAKFFAAWMFTALVLLLTFPMWLTVNYLGEADQGIIIASYKGSWLLAGAFLAIGGCVSVLTRNQIIAFLISMTCCFLLMVSDFPIVLEVFGNTSLWLKDVVASLSMLHHYHAITKGVLAFNDLAYFILMIVTWLGATVLLLDLRKAR